jgi:4-hydroxythreonine-4-phosphate dehydrogenase
MVLFADKKHLPNNVKVTTWCPGYNKSSSSDVTLCQINFSNVAVPGQTDPQNAAGVIKAIECAVDYAKSGKVAGLCTAPINKANLKSGANFNFPGHTEYLAHIANADDVLMLLVAENLRIGVATGHIAIKDVASSLTSLVIKKKLELMSESLALDFGCASPKIAVLGLNPHAGDNGLMGEEEKTIISPAIRDAKASGVNAFGPYAADGFFGSGAYKDFDGVLAMYHDQGLAPFKALSFGRGVNFTAGLPIVRTSPDHGTGFDIAGKGIAMADSMRAAIYLAQDIRRNRVEHKELSSNPLEITPAKREYRDNRR